MKQLEGFTEPGYESYICKLVHTIYGTMQGAHDWYETLGKTYKDLGYTNSCADPCVWFKKENSNYTITDTYTDNFLVHQIMGRRKRGGRKKFGMYGRLRMWERMSTFSG